MPRGCAYFCLERHDGFAVLSFHVPNVSILFLAPCGLLDFLALFYVPRGLAVYNCLSGSRLAIVFVVSSSGPAVVRFCNLWALVDSLFEWREVRLDPLFNC